MKTYKSILIPVDFSDNSIAALGYALSIARLFKSKIYLLHAYQQEQNFFQDEPQNFLRVLNKDLKENTIQRLKEFASHYLLTGAFGEFEYIATEGKITDAILSAANIYDVDFIVMGTSGTGKSLRYGTIAQEVVTASKYPVLVIPPQKKFSGFNKIIYATDCNYSDTSAIKFLCELVKPYQGEVILVHIADENPESAQITFSKFRKFIEEEFPAENISFQVFSRKKISETLEILSQTHNADMLSMTSQKRNNFFAKIFNPSLTEEMALYTNVPLFAFAK
jgi:nucleotide-binding universal stress UspA family protein